MEESATTTKRGGHQMKRQHTGDTILDSPTENETQSGSIESYSPLARNLLEKWAWGGISVLALALFEFSSGIVLLICLTQFVQHKCFRQ